MHSCARIGNSCMFPQNDNTWGTVDVEWRKEQHIIYFKGSRGKSVTPCNNNPSDSLRVKKKKNIRRVGWGREKTNRPLLFPISWQEDHRPGPHYRERFSGLTIMAHYQKNRMTALAHCVTIFYSQPAQTLIGTQTACHQALILLQSKSISGLGKLCPEDGQ